MICTVAQMGSFGPVVALSSFSNNLNQTLASGERVLSINEVILKDYSIDLKPGKVIGIHGASGSGKSTFLKLLMRFWDVNRGEIDVDGREIKGIPTARLRDMESYVTQETHLFHDSIANNIAIGKSGGSREERIGIARVFLHDAPFLLLDEPTSNLDSLNEGIILKSLRESCDKKTVVLVSHRQSTMQVADEVYEMENGRIS